MTDREPGGSFALMSKGSGSQIWDTETSEAARSCSSERPLTHLIDRSDRQDEMNVTCFIEGCERGLFRNEMCSGHYDRLRRTGDPGPAVFREKAPGPRACKEAGCDRSTKWGAFGWCPGHYRRYQVHGSPGLEPLKSPGAPKPACSVDDCPSDARCNGFCEVHRSRWRKWGDPLTVKPSPTPPPTPAGAENPNWVGDAVGYHGVHCRLRSQRGRAASYACSHCGSGAQHWAYDHLDPHEKTSAKGHAYSTDLSHYMPLCVPCHARFDSQERNLSHG